MPYQLCRGPLRPWTRNSGYSSGKSGGYDVQKECVDCRRCMVSALPSSPDCTTMAISAAASARRKTGLLNLLRLRSFMNEWLRSEPGTPVFILISRLRTAMHLEPDAPSRDVFESHLVASLFGDYSAWKP